VPAEVRAKLATFGEKVAAWATEEYLEWRVRRASREKLEQALAELPDEEPESYDAL